MEKLNFYSSEKFTGEIIAFLLGQGMVLGSLSTLQWHTVPPLGGFCNPKPSHKTLTVNVLVQALSTLPLNLLKNLQTCHHSTTLDSNPPSLIPARMI